MLENRTTGRKSPTNSKRKGGKEARSQTQRETTEVQGKRLQLYADRLFVLVEIEELKYWLEARVLCYCLCLCLYGDVTSLCSYL